MKRALATIVLCLVSAATAHAQVCVGSGKRPSVGLVLGGGGARGGSEVGVLKVMRDLRIPVDFVVGTSMGSFVGVLHATGYTPEEIEQVLLSTDWPFVFSAELDRDDRPFRRKVEDREFLIQYRIGVTKKGLELPKGMVNSQRLRLLIRNLTVHVADVRDFDRLPLPYRAIGVDVGDGSEAVFARGELPDAVVASMSLPGIFPPVEMNGKMYVDGGLANNVPVRVAKDVGCQRVIAVDVGTPFYNYEQINSFFQVMDQSSTMLTRPNVLRSVKLLGPQDLLVRPELEGVTTTSFDKIGESIARGVQAAEALRSELARYSVSEAEYAAFEAARTHAKREPLPVIRNVTIKNETPYRDKTIASEVTVAKDKPLDPKELSRDIERLYAFDAFQRIQYDLKDTEEGKDLELQVKEDRRTRNYLRFGFRFSTDFNGVDDFSLGTSFMMTRLNRLGGEWKTDAEIGSRLLFATEFYQPLESRLRWFVVPNFAVGRRKVSIYNNQDIVAEELVAELRGGFAAGRVIGRWGEARAGMQWGVGDGETRIGTNPTPSGSFHTGRYVLRFAVDTVDKVNFPKKGQVVLLNWAHALDSLGSAFGFYRLEGTASQFLSFGKNTFSLGAFGGTSIDDNLPVSELFKLGGFLKLSGYPTDALGGNNYFLGRLIYYRDVSRLRSTFLSLRTYVGASFETGEMWNTGQPSWGNLVPAGSAFVGLDTVIGPIIVAYGLAKGIEQSAYLFIGRPF